ncbi:MAG: HAD family hydrolase [Azonexus sp.]
MLNLEIPGRGALVLEHAVFDYNGTLARDGVLLAGLPGRMRRLAEHLTLHVVTGDTFGHAASQLSELPCRLSILPGQAQTQAKRAYIGALGDDRTVAIGNGWNDHLMLQAAALSIAVLQDEGLAKESLLAADLVTRSVVDAIDLLLHPLRLAATLRT